MSLQLEAKLETSHCDEPSERAPAHFPPARREAVPASATREASIYPMVMVMVMVLNSAYTAGPPSAFRVQHEKKGVAW